MSELLSNEKVLIAIAAAAAAILGSLLTAVVSPWIKNSLEERRAKRERETLDIQRRREQIAAWRRMILDVQAQASSLNNVYECLELHPDYLSLEPLLSDDARNNLNRARRVITVGSALPTSLIVIKNEIARIERDWGLP